MTIRKRIIKALFEEPAQTTEQPPETPLQAHEITVSPANNTRVIRYLARLSRLYALPIGHIGAADEIRQYQAKIEALGHHCPPDINRCNRLIKILGG